MTNIQEQLEDIITENADLKEIYHLDKFWHNYFENQGIFYQLVYKHNFGSFYKFETIEVPDCLFQDLRSNYVRH